MSSYEQDCDEGEIDSGCVAARRLHQLLSEVRRAPKDARNFALFERGDELKKLGIDYNQINAFDATDDATLDRQIAVTASVARAPHRRYEASTIVTAAKAGQPRNIGQRLMRSPTVRRLFESGDTANHIAKIERDRALEEARTAGVVNAAGHPNTSNNQYDAERHARWAYRTSKAVGPGLATLFGIGHELDNLWHGGPLRETFMDLHNNGVGIGQFNAHGNEPDLKTPGLQWFGGRNARPSGDR